MVTSARSKLVDADSAFRDVASGITIAIGEVLDRRRPLDLCRALAASGASGLHVMSFLAGQETEVLAVVGAVAELTTGYIDPLATEAGIAEGRITLHEMSEHHFVGALQAAAAGLPCWLTLGGVGSDVVSELRLAEALQRGSITLQFVSPAQVDSTGAINTSRVRSADGAWRRLAGCLALPDTTAMVGRMVAYRVGGGERFLVDRVDHITGAGRDPDQRQRFHLSGRGVVAVITDEGRRAVESGGFGPITPLEPIPAEAAELLSEAIDPHGVLGLESRAGRDAAQAAPISYLWSKS